MNIFSAAKDLFGRINKIDGSIDVKGRDYAEVYARNIALKEEIEARTRELEQATKTILTLNSVLDMMNSPMPLSNMLDKIVSILHNDMGYNFAAILKIEKDENGGNYFAVKSISNNESIKKVFELAGQNSAEAKLPYREDFDIVKAVKEKQIYSSESIDSILADFFPQLEKDKLAEITSLMHSKIFTIAPLYSSKGAFGCIIVSSSNGNITDAEKNFLSLYAKQAELAVTAAGLFEEVKKQAVTDPLTGLYNRRYFEENIIKEAERSIRLKQPFSLISLDLDYLKRINDTYGHQYGDLAIKTISEILKKEARSIDTAARMGGEEFSILLPGVDSKGGLAAAERIRKAIANHPIDTIGGITASIGVAAFIEHSDRIDELIEMADRAMYQAKLYGRNQVRLAKSKDETDWRQTAIDAILDIAAKKVIPIDEDTEKEITDSLRSIKYIDDAAQDALFNAADIIAKICSRTARRGISKSKQLLAVKLAEKINLPKEEIDNLKIAVLLYDIGNIMIPDKILNKKEPLTAEEKELIKKHPAAAAREILKPISNIQDIIPIIENHHENWDGSGYPGHKAGLEIPIASQIVLITDAFYAMLEDRPYRLAYSVEEIIKIIKKEEGRQWNKELADNFIDLIKNKPVI